MSHVVIELHLSSEALAVANRKRGSMSLSAFVAKLIREAAPLKKNPRAVGRRIKYSMQQLENVRWLHLRTATTFAQIAVRLSCSEITAEKVARRMPPFDRVPEGGVRCIKCHDDLDVYEQKSGDWQCKKCFGVEK